MICLLTATAHAGPIETDRVLSNLSLLTEEAGLHIGALTFGMVDFGMNVGEQTGHFRVGGGDPSKFQLQLDGAFVVNKTTTRVNGELNLALAGYELSLTLPPVDLTVADCNGERAMLITLPVFQGKF